MLRFEDLTRQIKQPRSLVRISGKVCSITGSNVSVRGISCFVRVGDFVKIEGEAGPVMGEVLALHPEAAQVQFLDTASNITIGAAVEVAGSFAVSPSDAWRGRVLDALANPIDGLGPLMKGYAEYRLDPPPLNAMTRGRVGKALKTGVKAIDVFTPLCFGQRIGVFAGSGVGKSTLLAMLSRTSSFDTTVVALVGERGREVQEFISDTLGSGLQKSVVVVSTSDEPAARRKLVPLTATAIAEYFRDQGQNVLLVMDSATRYAHALRELSLAMGEPPVARGYPPSVFGRLPRLMERAGPGADGNGSITAVYAVLVDGDNHNEPIADNVRGILDGHIVLSREIASSGRYPAIDILGSLSRLADQAWKPEEARASREMRKLASRFEDTRDLRLLGGYQQGTDPELDRAVAYVPRLYAALNQSQHDELCMDAFAAVARAVRSPAG